MAHPRKGVTYRVTKKHDPDGPGKQFQPGDVVRRTGDRVEMVRKKKR